MNARLACLLTALASAGLAHAQWPMMPLHPATGQWSAMPPLPGIGASPLLYVRLSPPAGTQATFYQGRAAPRSFPAPVVVGLRPGYCYRLRLDHLPDHPGVPLYPSLEVRGSLKLTAKCAACSFPATVPISREDIDAALAGSLVTKVIYLEDPDRAEPTPTRPGEILETPYPVNADLLKEARSRGRVMVVLHLGGRTPTADELAAQNVFGTMLLPGQRVISPAMAPPSLPYLKPGFYDPYHGPGPLEEECLHDGGDRHAKVGFSPEGTLGGLDPEDTVATYRDSGGRRQIIPSNRVCLCVPRFAALRTEIPLARAEGVVGPADRRQVKRDVAVQARQGSELASQTKTPRGLDTRMRPGVALNQEGPGQFIGLKVLQAQHLDLGVVELIGTKGIDKLTPVQKLHLLQQMKLAFELEGSKKVAQTDQVTRTAVVGRVKGGPEVVTASVHVRDLTVCCNEAPIPPEKPLVLVKCADRSCAEVGDIITFSLRYSNHGGRPITDVAVSDSLSGRLEFIPGSVETDRDAVFTHQPNEAGSSILRWEVTGTLLPGQTGRIRFKVRVR